MALDCRWSSQRRLQHFGGEVWLWCETYLSLNLSTACSWANNKFSLLSISFFEISRRKFTLCNSVRIEWGNSVKCLVWYLFVSVTDICQTVLPTFPFLLFSCNLSWNHSMWCCGADLTEPGQNTPQPRTGWPFRTMSTTQASLGHLPAGTLVALLTKIPCWGYKEGGTRFGAAGPAAILPSAWKALVQELVEPHELVIMFE